MNELNMFSTKQLLEAIVSLTHRIADPSNPMKENLRAQRKAAIDEIIRRKDAES